MLSSDDRCGSGYGSRRGVWSRCVRFSARVGDRKTFYQTWNPEEGAGGLESSRSVSSSTGTTATVANPGGKRAFGTRWLPLIAELPQFEVLPIDTQVAILAGNAELERSGQPIGRADPMIAATASAHGLVLVTGNVGHYARLPDLGFELRIANWRD